MSDNVQLTPSGDIAAADDVGGVKFQRVKLATGAGQNRRIVSNTSTQLQVNRAWDITPDDNYPFLYILQNTGTLLSRALLF